MADHFVEMVRDSERAAVEARRNAQSDAKELVENAHRAGEKRLALAEEAAARLLAASAKNATETADKLLSEAEEAARTEAAELKKRAASRMDEAVSLILERVGVVWR